MLLYTSLMVIYQRVQKAHTFWQSLLCCRVWQTCLARILQWLMIETMQEIKGVNYDIITPKCMEDFRHGTWYDVKQGALLPYPTHLF